MPVFRALAKHQWRERNGNGDWDFRWVVIKVRMPRVPCRRTRRERQHEAVYGDHGWHARQIQKYMIDKGLMYGLVGCWPIRPLRY